MLLAIGIALIVDIAIPIYIIWRDTVAGFKAWGGIDLAYLELQILILIAVIIHVIVMLFIRKKALEYFVLEKYLHPIKTNVIVITIILFWTGILISLPNYLTNKLAPIYDDFVIREMNQEFDNLKPLHMEPDYLPLQLSTTSKSLQKYFGNRYVAINTVYECQIIGQIPGYVLISLSTNGEGNNFSNGEKIDLSEGQAIFSDNGGTYNSLKLHEGKVIRELIDDGCGITKAEMVKIMNSLKLANFASYSDHGDGYLPPLRVFDNGFVKSYKYIFQ